MTYILNDYFLQKKKIVYRNRDRNIKEYLNADYKYKYFFRLLGNCTNHQNCFTQSIPFITTTKILPREEANWRMILVLI